MAIVSTRQAQQLGRLGGKASAADRKGNSEWGRRAQRQRAAAVMHLAYPGLSRLWPINAARTRWGLPLLPVPDVPLSERRQAQKEARHLEKRRGAFERDRARGGRCCLHHDGRDRFSRRKDTSEPSPRYHLPARQAQRLIG
jgi:hypothetical protein